MTINMAKDMSYRLWGLLLSISLHLAAGLLLLVFYEDGAPRRQRASGNDGTMLIIELQPLKSQEAQKQSAPVPGKGPLLKPPSADVPTRSSDSAPAQTVRSAAGSDAPETSPPESGAIVAGKTVSGAEMLAYRRQLEGHLARYRIYPASARTAGEEGVVVVHFEMTSQGQVLRAWIESTSGITVIDREALDALRRAQPLPPFPAGWPGKLDVSLPVAFKLG